MSSLLTLDTSVIRDIGGEYTAREICQQPAVWRKAFNNVLDQEQNIDAFLKPLFNKSNLRIILTGAGTSAFAGQVVAPYLARQTGLRFEAVSTTDIVATPHEYLAEQVPTLMVSLARSGNSPESVAAVALLDQLVEESHHLVLTCNPDGNLAQAANINSDMFCQLMPSESNDLGFAMTSSFTSMMLSAIAIFTPSKIALAHQVEQLCQTTEQLINETAEDLKKLVTEKYERVVFLGSGSLQGLAQEAALKLLELTSGRIVSYYDSPLGFRHGPKSVVNEKTLIIQFMGSDSYTCLYERGSPERAYLGSTGWENNSHKR